MGQPRVASATWHDRIRRISQGFYETVGQQTRQTRASKAALAWSHVKILNRVLRPTVIFLRKPKGIRQTFRLWGRQCFVFYSERLDLIWIMTSEKFIEKAVSNKTGKNIGKRSIWFNGNRKDKTTGILKEYCKPQFEKYLDREKKFLRLRG
jgi:hypothetical protein